MPHACILSSVHNALDNRVFYREARSLQRAGYKVTVIALHERSEINDGIRIIGLPRVPRWKRPLLWGTLFRHAVQARADVFHFHDPELLLIAPWLRLCTGKPAIYDVHEAYADFITLKEYLPAPVRALVAWLFARLEPLLARLQSALIFADDQIAKSFTSVHRPKTTLYNYPEGAFVEQAVAATRDMMRRPPAVLHLGGHKEGRGIHLILDAFELVLETLPDARLSLVGPFTPPELEAQVRGAIAQRGIQSRIQITGRVPFEQVGEYLKKASVGWVAWEPVAKNQKNIPTKLFEYMAYGLPVVSSDLIPIRSYVRNGENGYLVTADDPTAHSQAILDLIQHPTQARDMGLKGQQLVRSRYNWDEMEKRLLNLYAEVLADHSPDGLA